MYSIYITLLAKFSLAEDDINNILNIIYNKMQLLPNGSTVYFSKNGKCTRDYNTPIFCLVNNSLFKNEENEIILIFNISEYDEDNYYEFNILNNTDEQNTNCIITFFKNKNNNDNNNIEIKVLYLKLNRDNQVTLISEKILDNLRGKKPINKYIKCQKEFNNRLTCFYCDNNKKLNQIYIIIREELFITNNEPDRIKDEDINLENLFMTFSILKNQVEYFLCLNSGQDSFKIYTHKNFPPQASIGRRLERELNYNNNKFSEFIFNCNGIESLLVFAILDDNMNKNCLAQNSNTEGEYHYFFEQDNNLFLYSHNNISCLNEAGIINKKQIFFIERINETNEITEETIKTSKISKTTNQIEKTDNTDIDTKILQIESLSTFNYNNYEKEKISESTIPSETIIQNEINK